MAAPVIISPPRDSYGPLGANLTLDCEARGNPAPEISWRFVSAKGETVTLPSEKIETKQKRDCGLNISFVPPSRRRPERVHPDARRPGAHDGDRLGADHGAGPGLHRGLPLHCNQHRRTGKGALLPDPFALLLLLNIIIFIISFHVLQVYAMASVGVYKREL